jgi:hypothetical protein
LVAPSKAFRPYRNLVNPWREYGRGRVTIGKKA